MSFRSQIIKYVLPLFLLPFLFAEQGEIRVELPTHRTLAPLYLSRFIADQSPLESTYLTALRQTLAFDLHHSGYLALTATQKELETALAPSDPNAAFVSAIWEKAAIDIALKAEVIGTKLNLYAYHPRMGSLKKFEGIPLSGDMAKDRMQMHKLSEALLQTLCGVEAITTTQILYSVQPHSNHPSDVGWKAEIWACDYDGKNPRQITYEDSYSMTPVWIPSHPLLGRDRYLYVNYKNGQPKIYYSSISSKTGRPLITLRGNQLLPAINRDRSKVAFISDATGRPDLFIQHFDDSGNPKGKPKQLFSYPQSTQASPTFSPDGSHIAFVSDKDGSPRIYLIPAFSHNNRRNVPTLLTRLNTQNTCPSWSPDGTKLAYSAKTNGIRQIWIYDFSTGEEVQLTSGPGNKENPAWAPDNLHLVFNSTDPNHSELYLINLNQPKAVKITHGPGKKHYPTWGKR